MASRGMHVTTRVDGLNAVIRDLVAIGLEVEDPKDAMSEVARLGAVMAARYAPKLSGRLSRDIRGNRAKAKAVIAAGRVSVPYAGPINYGWAKRGITASGFMQKADRALQPRALRILEGSLNQSIRRRGLA
ncbi:hypothetical protein RB608_11980 [Nocardioides sp. LHD-245]|uniref:hypothetical protein n=1 Tax=Nocardioides sp. LHD-245 TaxID=3051387 RepID=UPI0027E0D791|nr:hypothetical protein [Nocardioides sp. LHD-245]